MLIIEECVLELKPYGATAAREHFNLRLHIRDQPNVHALRLASRGEAEQRAERRERAKLHVAIGHSDGSIVVARAHAEGGGGQAQ